LGSPDPSFTSLNGLDHIALCGHSCRSLLDVSKRRMALGHIELNAGRAGDRGVSHFSDAVFKALRHDHLDTVLCTRHRILDRLNVALQDDSSRCRLPWNSASC
jgi:hypothetical protein